MIARVIPTRSASEGRRDSIESLASAHRGRMGLGTTELISNPSPRRTETVQHVRSDFVLPPSVGSVKCLDSVSGFGCKERSGRSIIWLPSQGSSIGGSIDVRMVSMKTLCAALLFVALTCGGALIGVIVNANDDGQDQWSRNIAALRAPDQGKRIAAAEALTEAALIVHNTARTQEQRLVLKEQLQTLAQIIRDKTEPPRVRRPVIHAIAVGELGPTGQVVVPAMINVLADETDDEDVRSEAAMCLPYVSTEEVVGRAILAATKSRSERVRVNALEAIGQLTTSSGSLLPLLSRAVSDSSPTVRGIAAAYAAELVRKTKDKRSLIILVRAAHDSSDGVRQMAAMLLRSLGANTRGAEGELESLVTDPDPTIRANAAVALMILGNNAEKNEKSLRAMLHSSDITVRRAVARSLVTSGREASGTVSSLTKALDDPDKTVRRFAALALISITGEAAQYAPTLVEGLADENELTRMWVAGEVELVAARFKSVFRPLLLKMTKHKDRFARSIAFAVLERVFAK